MLSFSFNEDDVTNISSGTGFKRVSILLQFFLRTGSKYTNPVFIVIIGYQK